MIQEIKPHKMDIAFQECAMEEHSRVLFFHEGKILVINRGNDVDFLQCREVADCVGDAHYLFSLDGDSLFRVELKDKEEFEKLNEELTRRKLAFAWQGRSFFRTAQPKERAFAAITAMHLDGWYRKNRLCGVCGTELERDHRERAMVCPVCGNVVYPRINPAVIVAVTDGTKLLLTKYRDREYKRYALVAGFVEIGETLEETVQREVMEETGLKVKNIRYYKSQPWGFTDNILVGFYCEVDGASDIVMDREELSVAEWVECADIEVRPEDLSLTNEMICKFCIDKSIS